jgi:peroxiredoxin
MKPLKASTAKVAGSALSISLIAMAAFCFSPVLYAASGLAELKTGQAAPEFELTDSAGKKHKLSQYKGKVVVLEWLNHGCPFVQKFYDAGKMQELQKTYTGKGVVWLSVISSAPGKQGHGKAADVAKEQTAKKSNATAVLMDESGAVGKKFGARTTPHMYVVATDGKLAYQGAMDDQASTDKESIAKAKNYVVAALDASLAGKKIETATTEPYGCSVKYKD